MEMPASLPQIKQRLCLPVTLSIWIWALQVDPTTGRAKVYAITEDGRREEGDLLIGADGIRSKACTTMSVSACRLSHERLDSLLV